jgi:putative endonuclease
MYILRCAGGQFYTGSTTNLKLRLAEHNAGIGANFTSKRLPVKLVYQEEFARISDAFYREKQIQKWGHAKKAALIKGDVDTLRKEAKKDFTKRR